MKEVSPARRPGSHAEAAARQPHSQDCFLIVQLDNCHLSLPFLSVSHKGMNGTQGGGQLEEGFWSAKVTRRAGEGPKHQASALN